MWFNPDSQDSDAPEAPGEALDARTETVQRPYQPPTPNSTDTGTYQRPVESVAPTEISPPADLYRPPYESPPVYGLAVEILSCDVVYQFTPTLQAEMVPHDVVAQAICGIQTKLRSSPDNYTDNTDQLFKLFRENFLPYFDMRFAGAAVLGKHWRTATADQRDRFNSAFQIILIRRLATYIPECYQGELTILPYQGDASKRTITVKTRCQLLDGSYIAVDYALVNREDQWRIFDVSFEGVSYVRNYRTEFYAEIRETSLVDLIERLEAESSDGAAK